MNFEFCCTPESGDCCGPGSWCCTRAGKHEHEEEALVEILMQHRYKRGTMCECGEKLPHPQSPETHTHHQAEMILPQVERYRATMFEMLDSVMNLHDEDGQRWVGFPRADLEERYCTECNKASPCPTVQVMQSAFEGGRG